MEGYKIMGKEKDRSNKAKSIIFYSRTYRHLKRDKVGTVLFAVFFVLPIFALMLFYYDDLSLLMARFATWFMGVAAPGVEVALESDSYIPLFGPVYYITLPTVFPKMSFIFTNILITTALLIFFSAWPRKGQPISIYLAIVFIIHIMSCLFFTLSANAFSYTAVEYSGMYVKQQVGIWITFLVLIGLCMGLLGRGHLVRRVLTVAAVLLYSFVFGTIRYALFMWIISEFSVLYIPLMFFILGPFFDFLYFVLIYSISVNGTIKDKGEENEKWVWA